MSHGVNLNLNIEDAILAGPIETKSTTKMTAIALIVIGVLSLIFGYTSHSMERFWGMFFICSLYFLGLSLGAIITTCIFQITRAKWSPPIRRIAEAHIYCIPVFIVCLMLTYFGKQYLYPWGGGDPMPGREWWMLSLIHI